jgi:CTP:molybdopterin cytidylyltransferase MocA
MKELDPEGHVPVKALLPFLGKRMIDWQLEALAASPYVSQIYLLGLCEEHARFDIPVEYIPTDLISDPSEKLSIGLKYLYAKGYEPAIIVISTSDAPGVTQRAVDSFFSQLIEYIDYDFVLSVVPEALAEREFPKSGRTVARFRDHQVFPGELYALSPHAILTGQEIISEINSRRRKIDRSKDKISIAPMLNFVGRRPRTWPLILKFILGQATLADGERLVSLAFDCKVKSIIIEDAGFGMDIDLPGDYQRVLEYLSLHHQEARREAS